MSDPQRWFRWCATWLLVLVWSSTALAHSEEATVCVRTYDTVTVDGDLRDWTRRIDETNWSAQLRVKKGLLDHWMMKAVPGHVNTLTANVEAGQIDSPEDFSMVFYTMWDETNLYLAYIVVDNEVVSQHEGADIWQDDCVELWIDARHDAITRTLFQDDEYQIGLSPKSKVSRGSDELWVWRNPDSDLVIEQSQIASVSTEDGYVLEAAIPWRTIHGLKPEPGTWIGFNISAVDKDLDESWTHIVWSGNQHSNPTQFGHLYFVDAAIDLIPSDLKQLEQK